MDIIALRSVLSQCLDETSIKRMSVVVQALLTMTGRVTMLGLSRWTEGAGSYRTVQRFYNTNIPWGVVLWLFFQHHLYQAGSEYVLAGDESVVTKSGKETHGLDRFYSSIFGKPVRGLAFMALSLVSVEERKSYPLAVEQVIRSEEEKKAKRAKSRQQASKKSQKKASKRTKDGAAKTPVGRPKGSKGKDKRQIEWTGELRQVQQMTEGLLQRISPFFAIRYFVLDGHYGNNNVMQMVRQSLSLHIVSKLRHDSALHFRYDGPQKPLGRRRIYGDKIDYHNIPQRYLVQSTTEGALHTDIYQATMLHETFADPLNVVIIVKRNLATQKRAHVVLFSSDLALTYERLIDFYRLRFQIEFNFRDAKQFWGFEDFMNVNKIPVTNAVGLAFFMVNFSALLLTHFRPTIPNFGVLDLKAYFRSQRYLRETLKLLPDFLDPILIDQLLDAMPVLGSIHSDTCKHPLPS